MSKANEEAVAAWARLIRLQKQALDKVEKNLKKAGLPPLAWYDVLLELDRADSGLRQYEIGERILLNKHNLSRLLDRLEDKGHLQRKPCAEDGRVSEVRITANGRKLRKQMWPVYAAAIEEAFASRLSAEEVRVFGRTLAKLLD
jgi:DNA-binding MarR family transcriptional regulator